MYLVSSKVALNQAKIAVFLHLSYNYLRTCHPLSPNFELLKIICPGRQKSVKDLPNRSEGVHYCPKCQSFLNIFFMLHARQNVGKVHSASQNDVFSLDRPR